MLQAAARGLHRYKRLISPSTRFTVDRHRRANVVEPRQRALVSSIVNQVRELVSPVIRSTYMYTSAVLFKLSNHRACHHYARFPADANDAYIYTVSFYEAMGDY